MLHPPFNMSKGFVVDDLHSVYLGVMKQLLTCWFGVKYKKYGFSIRSKVILSYTFYMCVKCKQEIYGTIYFYSMQIKLCDQRLLSIKPPDIISRQIRSLSDYTHWKGTVLYTCVYEMLTCVNQNPQQAKHTCIFIDRYFISVRLTKYIPGLTFGAFLWCIHRRPFCLLYYKSYL